MGVPLVVCGLSKFVEFANDDVSLFVVLLLFLNALNFLVKIEPDDIALELFVVLLSLLLFNKSS